MIKNLTTGETYKDVAEAAIALGVYKRRISDHLSGYYAHIDTIRLKRIRIRLPKKYRAVRNDLRKPVRCLETRKVYVSVTSAAKAFGATTAAISRCVASGKPLNGYRFEWAACKVVPKSADLFGPIRHV
jgi:hypothetical protein